MIDITKKYRTRDGREVTGLHTRDGLNHPIGGYVSGYEIAWRANGQYYKSGPGDFDLLEVEQPDTELSELRAFRDAAIAKHPDLAPIDPIDAECRRIWDDGVGKATIAGLIRVALLRGIEIGKGAA